VVRVRLLGGLEITDDEGRLVTADDLPRRARQVLSVLAARHDRVQSKDALADAVWGEDLPGNHFAALEHYISVIRRKLQPGQPKSESFIVTRSGGYLFATDRARLDLAELRGLARVADSHPLGSPDRLRLRQQVLDLAVDLPFAEDEYADWAAAARAEVRGASLAALVELADAACAVDPERALRLAREAIEFDNYAEQSYQIAMRASMALGRADDALRWFEQCCRVLDEQLGIGPSPQTSQLRREILMGRNSDDDRPKPRALTVVPDAPAAPPHGAAPAESHGAAPAESYGAAPAESQGAPPPGAHSAKSLPLPGRSAPGGAFPGRAFLGRDTEIDLILSAVAPVIHIVGPVGAGKSALLAEVARRAPGRVAVGRGTGSGGALRLTWLRSALVQLGAGGAVLAAVDRAMSERRALSHDELEGVAAVFDRPGPVVLAVDDAHGLDEDSVTELAWLGHRSANLCITLTYRYPSVIAGKPVAAIEAGVVLRLAPLTEDELEPAGQPDLVERSGGIPALVAAAQGAPAVATAIAMHLARGRTRWMPPAAWELLRLTASLGSLRVDQVAALTGQPIAEVLVCVDQLVHAHLLVEGPGGHIRHRSSLVRAAVAEQVSTAHGMHMRERLASGPGLQRGTA
jgi:DNA-binding SARP family transcriptional activator